jgi:hypothetical protein
MIINPDSWQLLRLLQLTSPALPVGAYSYSEGIEYLCSNGIIQTDSNSIYEAIVQAEKNDDMGQKIYEYILQNKPNLEKIFEEIGVSKLRL